MFSKPNCHEEICANNWNSYCVVCADYVKPNLRKPSAWIEKKYEAHFGLKFPKNWYILETCCPRCYVGLCRTQSKENGGDQFHILKPVTWIRPREKYFCFACNSVPERGKERAHIATVSSALPAVKRPIQKVGRKRKDVNKEPSANIEN